MAYNRIYKDGKYIVEYLSSYTDAIRTLSKALHTSSAQNLISQNRQKNEIIRQNSEAQIAKLEILNNEEKIQEEINGIVGKVEEQEIVNKEISEKLNISITEYLIICIFVILILICLLILVCVNRKKK
jgi:hypothetical protein